jgi:hypothetical protein
MRDHDTIKAIAFELEQLIDENSLSGILEIIATIAHEKAEHLQVNWGAEVSAHVWTSAARKIERIASRIDI